MIEVVLSKSVTNLVKMDMWYHRSYMRNITRKVTEKPDFEKLVRTFEAILEKCMKDYKR